MYSYNRIHNDVDNVVRVELNSSSSYRPLSSARTATLLRQQPKKTTSSINRTGTFTKHEKEKPSSIIRSETFILKHHEESPETKYDDKSDYSTFTRSNKKDNFSTVEKKYVVDVGDKSHYNTYTRSKKKESKPQADKLDKSLYVNSNTYRKSEKQRVSIVPKDNVENVNTSTFTKSTKPKRVESLIKRFEWNFLKRNKEPKEASPSPSAHSTDSQKKSKNIFNLISGNTKKTTRDIGIECKMDDERDYYSNHNGMGTRKGSVQSISSDRKYRTVRIKDVRPDSEHRSRLGSMTTSVVKPMERRSKSRDYPYYENVKKSTPITPAPIRVDLRTNNKYYSDLTSESNRKPVGIASPQPQVRTRSSLRNGNPKIYENTKTPFTRSYAAPANRYNSEHEQSNSNNASKKDSSDRVSFREYREQQRVKNDSKRSNNNSEDELKKSYQQSFFIPV